MHKMMQKADGDFRASSGRRLSHGTFLLVLICLMAAVAAHGEEFRPPLTITKGGTYTGCYRSDDSEVPAILVNTPEKVELAGCHIVSSGIGIKAYGGSRLYVHHCTVEGQQPTGNQQWGRALDDYHPQDLTFTFNTVRHTGGLLIDHGDANTNFAVIRYNLFQDTDKRRADGTDGELRASILFNSVVPIRGEIAYNQFTNGWGESAVEDNINFGNSGGSEASPFLIRDNFICGAYPPPSHQEKYTGSGITVEGTGANTPETVSQHVQILRNQVVSTCNAGINVNDGHHIVARENRIVSAGILPDGRPSSLFWGGCSIWNGSHHDASLFHDVRMVDNVLGYRRPGMNVPLPDRQDYVVATDDPWSVQPGDNVSLPNPITLATEAEEWTRWQKKLVDAGIVLGAGGSVKAPEGKP